MGIEFSSSKSFFSPVAVGNVQKVVLLVLAPGWCPHSELFNQSGIQNVGEKIVALVVFRPRFVDEHRRHQTQNRQTGKACRTVDELARVRIDYPCCCLVSHLCFSRQSCSPLVKRSWEDVPIASNRLNRTEGGTGATELPVVGLPTFW